MARGDGDPAIEVRLCCRRALSDPKTAWFVPAIKDERCIPVDGQVVVALIGVALRQAPPQHLEATSRCWSNRERATRRSRRPLGRGARPISEDAGDSWTVPEVRLPPIAVVRFAPV